MLGFFGFLGYSYIMKWKFVGLLEVRNENYLWKCLVAERWSYKRELSFSRLIVVPLFFKYFIWCTKGKWKVNRYSIKTQIFFLGIHLLKMFHSKREVDKIKEKRDERFVSVAEEEIAFWLTSPTSWTHSQTSLDSNSNTNQQIQLLLRWTHYEESENEAESVNRSWSW